MPTEYKATQSALHPEEERLLQAAKLPAAALQPTHSPGGQLLGQPQDNTGQPASSGRQLMDGQSNGIDSIPPPTTLEDLVEARPANLPSTGPAKAEIGSQQPGAAPPPPAGPPAGLTQDLKPQRAAAEGAAAEASGRTSVHQPPQLPAVKLPHRCMRLLPLDHVCRFVLIECDKVAERGPSWLKDDVACCTQRCQRASEKLGKENQDGRAGAGAHAQEEAPADN